MAKAIRSIDKKLSTDPNIQQTKDIQEVLQAVTDSKEALAVFLDILKELHQAGMLDMMQGVLKARHEVGYLAIQQLNQTTMHHTIKNIMGVAQFLGKIEPDQLNKVLNGVALGLEKSTEAHENGKSHGIWGLTKDLRDPDVNTTLTTAIEFMKGMGEVLRKDSSPPLH